MSSERTSERGNTQRFFDLNRSRCLGGNAKHKKENHKILTLDKSAARNGWGVYQILEPEAKPGKTYS